MAGKKPQRWQDMDHSDEPLLAYRVAPRSQQTTGPIPEFLAKKRAEQSRKTALW